MIGDHPAVGGPEQRRWQALVAGDLDELDRLFADEPTYPVDMNAMADSKQSYPGALRDGVCRYVDIDVQDPSSRDFGSTAVVTGTVVAISESAGGRLVSALRYTDVCAEQDGAWQFTAWHSCPVPA